MKKQLIVMLFILAIVSLQAQSIERQVISSMGTTQTDGTYTMSFTIGEVAVTTLTDVTTTLTQGFHQGSVALSIKINPIVFLQGALLNPIAGEENLMRDDLRELYVPTTSPYADALTCDVSVFVDGGSSGTGLAQDNIVDWVFVELRDKTDNTLVEASTSALLQRDGDIVALDGVSNVEIPVVSDDYYVAIKHRNHLGIISINPVGLSGTVTNLDFTDANNQITYGTNSQSDFGMPTGIVAMWAGNVNGNKQIRYQGSGNDTNTIKDNVLAESDNTSGSNLYQYFGYSTADVDMKGNIRYQGSGNDANVIKDIVLAHPENTTLSNLFEFIEQLPENTALMSRVGSSISKLFEEETEIGNN